MDWDRIEGGSDVGQNRGHGFNDGLVRISVGLEDYEDLRADFIGALDQSEGSGKQLVDAAPRPH
jgi:hypothetical protein